MPRAVNVSFRHAPFLQPGELVRAQPLKRMENTVVPDQDDHGIAGQHFNGCVSQNVGRRGGIQPGGRAGIRICFITPHPDTPLQRQ